MKTIKLLLLSLCIPLLSLAQKVKINNDIVSIDGTDAFKIEGKMGMTSTSFSVYNLEGDLLLSGDGRNENNFMTVTFSGNNASLDYPLTIGMKKMFAKELVQMKVIKDGQLNPDGMKRFVAKYNGRADRDMVLTQSNTNSNVVVISDRPNLVQRNTKSMIFISGKTIKQDNKEIGSIESYQEASGGTVMDYFTIYDQDGIEIARAAKAMNDKEIEVTGYNGRRFSLYTKNNATDKFTLQKFIVEELIHKGFL